MNSSHRSATSAISNPNEHSASPHLELPSVQLEALADAFQEQLILSSLVKDRPSKSMNKNKVYRKSFLGQDVVSVVQALLQKQLNNVKRAPTREEALCVGRDIQRQFRFFVHVKCPSKSSSKTKPDQHLPLQDTQTDLYQFHYNMPMQVYSMKKQYPSLWDKVQLLEELTPIGSHKGIAKVHKGCFLGTQVVDVLFDVKLVKNRREAVHLVRRMNEKVGCVRLVMHPAGDGTNFRDDTSLYRFVPKEQRVSEKEATARKHKSKNIQKSSSLPALKAAAANGSTMDHSSKSLRNSTKSMDQSGKSRRGSNKSTESIKDSAYFEDRATGLRAKLDFYRQVKSGGPAATTNGKSFLRRKGYYATAARTDSRSGLSQVR